MMGMNHTTFGNQWDSIKGQLKQRYGQLTDDDLTFTEGKAEELYARLRDRLGISEDELRAQIEEFKSNAAGRVDQMKAKASEIADDVRSRVGSVVEDVKAKGSAAADEMKAQAGVAYEEARNRARSLREDGEDYVRQNPRESLLAALAAGFVAGLLIRR